MLVMKTLDDSLRFAESAPHLLAEGFGNNWTAGEISALTEEIRALRTRVEASTIPLDWLYTGNCNGCGSHVYLPPEQHPVSDCDPFCPLRKDHEVA